MDANLRKYAESNAPRYTSYPTAPHFSQAVDATVYERWLSELAPETTLSLYLHTPYCRQMCWYCGCHAFSAARDEPVADYVEAILSEIGHVSAALRARGVREIHWGGGTPNILSRQRFETIVARLRANFDLSALERHAIEIDPRLLTQDQAEAFARCGVNRVSLGVQDLDERVQAGIGRIQPFEVIETSVHRLRNAGIEALSFDLMYGLPYQTLESVRRTARRVATLKPARISVFGYAHVPWFKARQKLMDERALPDTEARFALAEAIRATLCEAGYLTIGYDHYALPHDPIAVAAREGALTRNFQGFVEGECDALIGFGPSAISTLPQGYAQNETEVGAWRKALEGGGFSTKRGFALGADDRMRRQLILQLLSVFQVNLADYGGGAAFASELARLAPLARDRLVIIDGERLSIPDKTQAFARIVAQVFDAYRDAGAARHSRAV